MKFRRLVVALTFGTYKIQSEMSKLKTQEFENTKKRKSFLHGYTQYLT